MYNFENIIRKHGYSEGFSAYLKPIYESLIGYYQDESLVYNALLNTEVASVDNIYNYLKEHNMLANNEGVVTESDLKRSSGVYSSVPEIAYENGVYQLTGVKRVVLTTNLSPEYKTGTLIHELCHLVKSYHNEYTISDDIMIEHSGLIERSYKLEFQNGTIKKTLIKEAGVGLEEGLTSVSEEEIARQIVSPNYTQTGYGAVNAIARNLINDDMTLETVKSAELYHNKQPLYEIFGDSYSKLEAVTDRAYQLTLDMFASIFDKEKMEEISSELNGLITNEYQPIRKETQQAKNNHLVSL